MVGSGDGFAEKRLYGLDGSHEIHQPGTLKVAIPPEVGGRRSEDRLHFLGFADELAAYRKKGRNGTADVRRGHAGAAALEVRAFGTRGFPLHQGAVRRRAREDLFSLPNTFPFSICF